MPKRKVRKIEFRADFDSSKPLPVSLTDAEMQDVRTEFVWFFTGQNSAKSLIEQRNDKFLDILYQRYKTEIAKMRQHYGLDEIISDMDYAQAWFLDWKKMELFSRDQFREKIRTSEDFALVWADLGITDSLEFRNWGITVQYDANDNASVNKPGKDQLTSLINSIVSNPEKGFHFASLFNPSNIEDRTGPVGILSVQFTCEPMSYEERVWWFFSNHYETGLEYEILLQDMKKDDLEKFKWYDDFISIPKYRINLFSYYSGIDSERTLDSLAVFNVMFLKTIAAFLNMESCNVSIFTLNGFRRSNKTKKDDVFIQTSIEPSKGLNIQNANIRFSRTKEPKLSVPTAD